MTPRRVARIAQLVAIVSVAAVIVLAACGILGILTLSGDTLIIYGTITAIGALCGVLSVAMGAHMSIEQAFKAGADLASRRGPTHIVPHVRTPRMRKAWPRLLAVGFVAPFVALLPVVVYEQSTTTEATAQATQALADAQNEPTAPVRCMRLLGGKLRGVTCEPLKSDEPANARGGARCWLWINARGTATLASAPCKLTVEDLRGKYPRLYRRARGTPRVMVTGER